MVVVKKWLDLSNTEEMGSLVILGTEYSILLKYLKLSKAMEDLLKFHVLFSHRKLS